MNVYTNPIDGSLTITADVPRSADTHPSGKFAEIKILNWFTAHGVDATNPAMVEMTMADGAHLLVWPDGTFVMYPHGTSGESYSQKITADGVVPNPYRS